MMILTGFNIAIMADIIVFHIRPNILPVTGFDAFIISVSDADK
jgi:hypothetical protein